MTATTTGQDSRRSQGRPSWPFNPILLLTLGASICCPPSPPPPVCSTSGLGSPSPGAPVPPITSATTGGTFSGDAVDVGIGVTVNLTSDLVILSKNDVHIRGKIFLPALTAPGSKSPSITIVSTRGAIVVDDGAYIGGGHAGPGADATGNGSQTGKNGEDGALIRLIADSGSIVVKGTIDGNGGGNGGNVTAGSGWTNASATAGDGGTGGVVAFCANENILISQSGAVTGAPGGQGGTGSADARSTQYSSTARGGIGHDGGDVIFQGLGPGMVTVDDSGKVVAGHGANGGVAMANGGRPGRYYTDSAMARGGNGGSGGALVLKHADANILGNAQLAGGDAGNGAQATANADAGAGGAIPAAGGNANARGGDGGGGGAAAPPGTKGSGGSGGDATVTPGAGGPGLAPGVGATSGLGTAVGGSGAAGAGQTLSVPVTPAIGTPGGAASPASVTAKGG